MSARKAAAGDGPYPLPDGWRWVKLGEVAEIVRTGVKPEHMFGDEPYLGLDCIAPGGEIARWTTTGDENVVSNKLAFSQEHVLMGKLRPYLGKIALPERGGLCSTDIIPIVPGDELDRRFLGHWLRTDSMVEEANKVATGANLPRISPKAIEQLDIPLPPLPEQRRIAEILDRAQGLRKDGESILRHLSDLTGAEFDRRFFGLPSEKIRLGDIVIDIDSGKSPKCESFSAESGGWGVLKLSAVTGGTYRPSENKAIFDKGFILQKNEVHVGDVLMTRKNTPELVGEVCYVDKTPEKMLIPDLIFRINLDTEKISGKFFQAMMMRPAVREKVRALAGGSAKSMSNISKARLREMEISVPPLDEQREFEKLLDKVLVLRGEASSLNSLYSKMFASLQSRAFRGEL